MSVTERLIMNDSEIFVFPCSTQNSKVCSYLSLEDIVVFAVNLLQIRYDYNENDPAICTKEQNARNYLTV